MRGRKHGRGIFGVSGIRPYASLSNVRETVTADGTTVALVLLAAIVNALQKEG